MMRKKVVKQKTSVKPKESSSAPVVVLFIIVVGLGIYILTSMYGSKFITSMMQPKDEPETNVSGQLPKVSPTPRPLPYEKQTYSISHGPLVTGPKPYEATIDPYDPKQGEKQTVTIKARYAQPISSVTVRLDTDGKQSPHTLTLSGGTATDGTWTGSWTTDDTHLYVYVLNIETKGSDGQTTTNGLTFR